MYDSYDGDYMPTPIEAMRIYWKKRVRRRFSVLAVIFLAMTFLCHAFFSMEHMDAWRLEVEYNDLNAMFLYTAAAEGSKSAAGMNEKAQKQTEVQEAAGAQEPVQTEASSGAKMEAPMWLKVSPFAQHRGMMPQPDRLFYNNLTACCVIVLLGMVPFLPLSVLALPMNAALLAAGVAVLSARWGVAAGVCSMLPHSIPKAAALTMSAALGSLLSREIRRGILRRPDARPMHALGMTVVLFSLIVVPLLLTAMAMECRVSPEVYAWVQAGGLAG